MGVIVVSNVKSPKVVLALDSFKGSLSSHEAVAAAAAGVRRVLQDAEILKIPVADGGEGTAQVLAEAASGSMHQVTCKDPLFRDIQCSFGLSKDRETAFIEVAASSGLTLVDPSLRDPLSTSSFGVGQQIKAALDLGARHFIICLGGSATVDGGAGLLETLGARFFKGSEQVKAIPKELTTATRIDASNLDYRLKEASFTVLCDVDNPLTGRDGAARIFGPQKGAGPEEIEFLDEFLTVLGSLYQETTGVAVLDKRHMGAAGGIPAALTAFFDAKIVSGIDFVLDFLNFDTKLLGANLVITGEGSLDHQSLRGKTPVGVCRRANLAGVPVVCIAGRVEPAPQLFLEAGFTAVFSICPGPMSLGEALEQAAELLAFQSENVASCFFATSRPSV